MASNQDLAAFSAMQGYLVAAGKLAGHSDVFKFGFNSAVGTTEETIWEQGGRYVNPTSATTMTASSSSANDAAAGTGAQTIDFSGLGDDYTEQTGTVTMNGQTGVTISPDLLRVNRSSVVTAGSNEANEGTIYIGSGTITAGVPANIYTTIAPGENQTLQSFYTIPANKKGYLFLLLASSFGNANASATVRLRARSEGGVFKTKDKFVLTRGSLPIPHFFPVPFDEKTDLEITGAADTGTIDVSGSITLLLVEK